MSGVGVKEATVEGTALAYLESLAQAEVLSEGWGL